ncbi:nucleoside phosphorylase [Trypanosoma cruzi]|uniref:Nucleoside phosphorylase n=2 Tax=Trypanosoma cruzi TaxID=5693 RepID=V5BP86_TRYCR|nr:nucleoside phosphorylase [Trypanosoma cruzi Dm28c]PBJ77963.1 nucleoside phosphorylase [Trypanosoma cruzi cruzi]PWU95621.1 putative nucleoside phosphorylase [Trypanosoma cruzi]RNF22513.1 nucleoside phosphorylase [Trypanosoma cruzi]
MSKATHTHGLMKDPDLPVTADGVTYHLNCKSDQLADRILLVGDPGRVDTVAAFFDAGSVRFRSENREIFIATGTYKGTPVSVLSTGMGTDNVEIVINEIHLLKEYDFERCAWRPRVGDADVPPGVKVFDPSSVKMIRVGTCGSPFPDMPLAALAITRHVIGMDNTCLYYKVKEQMQKSKDLQEVQRVVKEQTSLGAIDVYATKAHPAITNGIVAACKAFNGNLPAGSTEQLYVVGATATASGFYACQGRAVGRFREHLLAPKLVEELSKVQFDVSEGKEIVANIEMETSAVCFLSHLLGYQAGSMCVVVAKRAGAEHLFTTSEQSGQALKNAIQIALEAIVAVG